MSLEHIVRFPYSSISLGHARNKVLGMSTSDSSRGDRGSREFRWITFPALLSPNPRTCARSFFRLLPSSSQRYWCCFWGLSVYHRAWTKLAFGLDDDFITVATVFCPVEIYPFSNKEYVQILTAAETFISILTDASFFALTAPQPGNSPTNTCPGLERSKESRKS